MRTLGRWACRAVAVVLLIIAVGLACSSPRQPSAAACFTVAAMLLFIPFRKRRRPTVDSARYAAAIESMQGDDGDWRSDPATERQKSFARSLGVTYWEGISKGELSDRISVVTDR